MNQVKFTKEQYNPTTREIVLNLNENLHIHRADSEWSHNHPGQLLPLIDVLSPTGTNATFSKPYMDGIDTVYTHRDKQTGKVTKLILKYL